ncbi:MAG: cytochrome c peroxidase [Saprospiraceae bacterium]
MKIKILLCYGLTFFVALSESEPLIYPDYFPKPLYDFSQNPLATEKVALGKALFYDPILSKDETVSCASCHSSYNAFAHTDHDLSHGIRDQIGTRNAPALFNLAWQSTFMWDGAISHLDMQALAPITHPKEMDEDMITLVQKLQEHDQYPALFYKAFADSMVTGEHLLKAISQFQLTLISANAKYDQVKNGETQFSEQEQRGYLLFQENCNTCHTEPLFSNYTFANNALPIDTTLNDFGKGLLTGQQQDSSRFKIPSLRNLKYSYPYMHDGRFRKLNQVLEHYTSLSEEELKSSNLEKPIVLAIKEKIDLQAFLLTLNDVEFVFNPQHQFPRDFFFPKKEKRQ